MYIVYLIFFAKTPVKLVWQKYISRIETIETHVNSAAPRNWRRWGNRRDNWSARQDWRPILPDTIYFQPRHRCTRRRRRIAIAPRIGRFAPGKMLRSCRDLDFAALLAFGIDQNLGNKNKYVSCCSLLWINSKTWFAVYVSMTLWTVSPNSCHKCKPYV